MSILRSFPTIMDLDSFLEMIRPARIESVVRTLYDIGIILIHGKRLRSNHFCEFFRYCLCEFTDIFLVHSSSLLERVGYLSICIFVHLYSVGIVWILDISELYPISEKYKKV